VDLSFRPIDTEADLALAKAWLLEPHVALWWKPDDLDDLEDIEPWLLLVDGRPAGFFQTVDIDADPHYAAACAGVGVGPSAGGLDYYLGPADLLDRGIGSLAIGRFAREVVLGRHPHWVAACAGPDPANGRSRRALEKAGFELAGRIEAEDGPEDLMVLRRT
jgi:RimJ/RimL family protein N-acetyltransferase